MSGDKGEDFFLRRITDRLHCSWRSRATDKRQNGIKPPKTEIDVVLEQDPSAAARLATDESECVAVGSTTDAVQPHSVVPAPKKKKQKRKRRPKTLKEAFALGQQMLGSDEWSSPKPSGAPLLGQSCAVDQRLTSDATNQSPYLESLPVGSGAATSINRKRSRPPKSGGMLKRQLFGAAKKPTTTTENCTGVRKRARDARAAPISSGLLPGAIGQPQLSAPTRAEQPSAHYLRFAKNRDYTQTNARRLAK